MGLIHSLTIILEPMKLTMNSPLIGAVLTGSALLVSHAFAATSFENSLKGVGANGNNGGLANSSEDSATVTNLNNAGLEPAFILGGDSWERIDFSTSGATFGTAQGGDPGRNYLRTTDKDYFTTNFTAEVLFTTDAGNGIQAFFMGMGAGVRGTAFGFPDIYENGSYTSVFLEARDGGAEVSTFGFKATSGAGAVEQLDNARDALYSNNFSWGQGTHRAIMSFDVAAQAMTFQLDLNNDGSMDGGTMGTMVVDVSELMTEWSNGDAAALFIGGDDGIVLSDWKVTVPEPSQAAMLVGVSALALAAMRRR